MASATTVYHGAHLHLISADAALVLMAAGYGAGLVGLTHEAMSIFTHTQLATVTHADLNA